MYLYPTLILVDPEWFSLDLNPIFQVIPESGSYPEARQVNEKFLCVHHRTAAELLKHVNDVNDIPSKKIFTYNRVWNQRQIASLHKVQIYKKITMQIFMSIKRTIRSGSDLAEKFRIRRDPNPRLLLYIRLLHKVHMCSSAQLLKTSYSTEYLLYFCPYRNSTVIYSYES